MNSLNHAPTLTSTLQSYLTQKARVDLRPDGEKGVFAREPIAKDELVAMWGGAIHNSLDAVPAELRRFALQIDEYLYIAPRNAASVDDAEYFNHSCDPNCGIQGQIALVAMRDIMPGEELSFDYAMAETYDQAFECGCGSRLCRGVIRGTDHQLPELLNRYRGYFSSWLEQKNSSISKDDFRMQYEATGAWGLDTALDLHDCDPDLIRDAEAIRAFTYELCDRIEVKRFGEPVIVHFGQDERVAGYSLVQLIETSLISGHFANLTNRVYLDVFSCAYYEPEEVAKFAQEFFKARSYTIHSLLRQ